MASTSPVSPSDRSARPLVAGTRPRSTDDDNLDYGAVGLISGLEVHQQLLTARKLFCQCPTGRLPETALMKLSWVLGQTDEHDEVLRMMRTPVAGETTVREPHNGYLILQGGLPETEAFISSHWK